MDGLNVDTSPVPKFTDITVHGVGDKKVPVHDIDKDLVKFSSSFTDRFDDQVFRDPPYAVIVRNKHL